MGRTVRKCGPALSIQLSNSSEIFQPGAIIRGNVIRKAHVVSVAGRINIKFLGRSKTKIKQRSSGDRKTDYRGCANFFTIYQMRQTIHAGPLHVAPNGEPAIWPFVIAIPEYPNPTAVCSGNSQKHNYISVKPEDIAEQPLPGTFYCQQPGWGNDFEGYVEYWLEATIHLEGRSHVDKAILPIKIYAQSTTTAVADLALRERSTFCRVSTLRMIPGMEHADIGFKQKVQKLFGSSKVPRYHFQAQIQAPSVIQLEHPDPVPFSIRAIPLPEKISSAIRDVPQVITVESVEMRIKSCWEVMCPGNFLSSTHTESGNASTDLGLKSFFPELKRHGPIVVPQGEDAEYVNIGEHLELKLHLSWVYAFGRAVKRLPRQLYPSFTTYNIKHKNFIKWAVTLQVADQQYVVSGSQEVLVLGPSQEQEMQKRINAGMLTYLTGGDVIPQYEDLGNYDGHAEILPSYEEVAGGRARSSRT
jgi:hypothetical protein